MRALVYPLPLLLTLSLLLPIVCRAQECLDYGDYPHLVGRLDWPSTASYGGLALAGNVACVVMAPYDEPTRLRTIDISNPSAPVIVGEVILPGQYGREGVTVVGSLAYMAVRSGGIRIVDISNPESPFVIGGVDTPGQAYDVAVLGNHAYVADGLSGIQVVDVSNPALPVIVGTLDTMEARGIVVAGNHVYIADDYDGPPHQSHLKVVDISNPVSPILAGSVVVPGQAQDVTVDGAHAYVTCGPSGVQVIDISSPALPLLRGHFFTQQLPETRSVAVAGDHLYVGTITLLWILNISDPNSPALVTQVGGMDGSEWLAVDGSHAYVSGSSPSFGVVDISNLDSPPVIGQVAAHGRIALAGHYAYLTGGYHDLWVVDVSNPTSPAVVGDYQNSSGNAWNVTVNEGGDYAYVVRTNAFRVYNISSPTNPTFAGSATVPGRSVAVSGNHAYVVGFNNGLTILDTSNPPNFPIVATFNTVNQFYDLAVAGDYCYLESEQGLTVVDISDPTAPVQVGSVELPNELLGSVTIVGSYVYVAHARAGLWVIDVSNPAGPNIIGFADMVARDTAVIGDYAYVNSNSYGLQIVDVSVPSDPQPIGAYVGGWTSTTDVAASGMLVHYTGFAGLTILPPQCANTAGMASPALAPEAVSLDMSFPNPFSGSTVIPYQLPAPAQVSLRIYDISGRMVRVLEENVSRMRGRHLASWNGRDAEGRPLPAGVYVYRLEAGDRVQNRRLTLLR